MPRYIAFLRAINVGGHTVKMDRLRELFSSMGHTNVETFIASGNVVFDSPGKAAALERTIEATLEDALGYEVATFIRTPGELVVAAERQPFPVRPFEEAVAFNVGFLRDPLDPTGQRKLMTLRTDIDDFRVQGREIYWLCRKRQSESTFSNAVLERALGCRATIRGAKTLKKMADKYGRD
ncbi:MAG: DUF1697 domain-containing protein [Acidobacteriota bacterium]|nr:DUF1697 domain-containing protein [Acidobacteriota bacterium]